MGAVSQRGGQEISRGQDYFIGPDRGTVCAHSRGWGHVPRGGSVTCQMPKSYCDDSKVDARQKNLQMICISLCETFAYKNAVVVFCSIYHQVDIARPSIMSSLFLLGDLNDC